MISQACSGGVFSVCMCVCVLISGFSDKSLGFSFVSFYIGNPLELAGKLRAPFIKFVSVREEAVLQSRKAHANG